MNEKAYSARYELQYPLEPLKMESSSTTTTTYFSYPSNPDKSSSNSSAHDLFSDSIFNRIEAQMHSNRRLAGIEKYVNYNRFFPIMSSQIHSNTETLDEEYLIEKLEQNRLGAESQEVQKIVDEGSKANIPYSTLLSSTIRFLYRFLCDFSPFFWFALDRLRSTQVVALFKRIFGLFFRRPNSLCSWKVFLFIEGWS